MTYTRKPEWTAKVFFIVVTLVIWNFKCQHAIKEFVHFLLILNSIFKCQMWKLQNNWDYSVLKSPLKNDETHRITIKTLPYAISIYFCICFMCELFILSHINFIMPQKPQNTISFKLRPKCTHIKFKTRMQTHKKVCNSILTPCPMGKIGRRWKNQSSINRMNGLNRCCPSPNTYTHYHQFIDEKKPSW